MHLAGSHVLVTGASRGIGAALAHGAARRGARVTMVARPSAALTNQAEQVGGLALPVDLASRNDRKDVIRRAEQAAGQPVDVLINCAGLDGLGGLLEIGAEQLAELFEVNLVAPAELTRQLLPGLVARGHGHIVDVSSGFSAVSAPGLVPYSASKAGLSHFHAGVRTELRGSGVGTTLVEIGPVQTQMWAGLVKGGLASAALRRFARLRLSVVSEPEQVAQRTLDAIEQGRRHVVLPRRMTPVMMIGWITPRVSDLALRGVPRR